MVRFEGKRRARANDHFIRIISSSSGINNNNVGARAGEL